VLDEVVVLRPLSHLGRDEERNAGRAGDACRDVHSLVGAHAAEEQRVTAVAAARGILGHVEPVVDDRDDRNVPGP
jgi:hypothetical protein